LNPRQYNQLKWLALGPNSFLQSCAETLKPQGQIPFFFILHAGICKKGNEPSHSHYTWDTSISQPHPHNLATPTTIQKILVQLHQLLQTPKYLPFTNTRGNANELKSHGEIILVAPMS